MAEKSQIVLAWWHEELDPDGTHFVDIIEPKHSGFTHHDVWIIKTLADMIDTMHPGGIRMLHEAQDLAARIAALLPTETS